MDELKELTITDFSVDMQTGTLSGSGEGPDISNARIVLTPQPGWTVTSSGPPQISGSGQNPTSSPWSAGFSNGFGPVVFSPSPVIALRVSKDGGGTYGNFRTKSLVSAGHYRNPLRWRSIGMGRDLVFEVSWSAPMSTGLNQAFANAIPHAA